VEEAAVADAETVGGCERRRRRVTGKQRERRSRRRRGGESSRRRRCRRRALLQRLLAVLLDAPTDNVAMIRAELRRRRHRTTNAADRLGCPAKVQLTFNSSFKLALTQLLGCFAAGEFYSMTSKQQICMSIYFLCNVHYIRQFLPVDTRQQTTCPRFFNIAHLYNKTR